jgi:hypothetical protein
MDNETMNKKAYQLKQALSAPTAEDRDAMLELFIKQNHYSMSPQEILALIQLVCEIGQPFIDTVCPLIINA